MKVYISGPITGVENYKDSFDTCERLLTENYDLDSLSVFNPAKIQGIKSWAEGMKKDVPSLFESSHICFLDGWFNSAGCRIEYLIARCLHLKVLRFNKETERFLSDSEMDVVFAEESRRALSYMNLMRIPEVAAESEPKVKEMVNHPEHYNGGSEYECYKVLKAWLSPEEFKGWCRGNAIKYLCRLGKKDKAIQELNKSIWYNKELIEVLENE